MLEVEWTASFKKDLKKFKHAHGVIKELDCVIETLTHLKPLAVHHRDHNLSGKWVDHRECHVKNDVLLIYRTDPKTLILVRFGSHSELF